MAEYTDNWRREVARRLREIKPNERLRGHVPVEDVIRAFGVNSDFGCVRADALGKLADLIYPEEGALGGAADD